MNNMPKKKKVETLEEMIAVHNHDGQNSPKIEVVDCKHQNQGEGKCFDCGSIIKQ